MNKGGKIKVRVTHVPCFIAPTFIHLRVGFLHHGYLCTMACGLECFLITHFIPSLYQMTPYVAITPIEVETT